MYLHVECVRHECQTATLNAPDELKQKHTGDQHRHEAQLATRRVLVPSRLLVVGVAVTAMLVTMVVVSTCKNAKINFV